jgi:hypothetical protein
LERAISVRHFAKDRTMDEQVIPSFEYEENGPNPLIGKRMSLDRTQFKPVVDDYLARLGWDLETGWPTSQRLAELDLDIHAEMVLGAQNAQARLPKLPPVPPIEDTHRFDPQRKEQENG